MKIASFRVDHNKLEKGVYVSRRDGDTVTLDLRMAKPYVDPLLDNSTLHSLEHTLATALRNGKRGANVVYCGPMGCQTGFYCVFFGLNDAEIFDCVRDTFRFLATQSYPMPGAARAECGNALNLSLDKAVAAAKAYYALIEDKTEFDKYPE
ncbi:MAG: S-ribosylhomocysteine lyase [Clostridiales bacterium]|jgi:S-ribosylhomocysteine lyase|nr:S-ribosylhomocysteine lyase [Clostridiales bacterium]